MAGQAVTSAVSPDGKTLLILTSGYNQIDDGGGKPIPAASNEYIFVDDITGGRTVQKQALQVPDSFVGLAFAPDGKRFYVSGGADDEVHEFVLAAGVWAEAGAPIALGHLAHARPARLLLGGNGFKLKPAVAGLAVTDDGKTLVAANLENDSVSVIDLASRAVTEVPLRPGLIDASKHGVAGGEYPYWVAIQGNATAYVSSERDREIDVVRLSGTPAVTGRIKVTGNPNRMVLSHDGGTLYVACDNEDLVEIIATAAGQVIGSVHTAAPAGFTGQRIYHGAAPDSLALSADGKRLLVANGGTNSVAVVALDQAAPAVIGLIPAGYYPNSVSVAGNMLYVVNGKSLPGPNPGNCSLNSYNAAREALCNSANQYVLQLSKAGLLSLPVPNGDELARLTKIVAVNNHFGFRESDADHAMMEFLHRRIRHVIYIIRENRTYDQVLGDLGEGNGDASLAEFGAAITPNAHRLARNFGDLDNFYDSGEVSGNGWPWSTAARESDLGVKTMPVYYADRGLSYDVEGDNRNVNIAIPTLAGRQKENPLYPNDPDLLPGEHNVAAPDGAEGEEEQGYIWDAALRAQLSVRNYGFFIDLSRYGIPAAKGGIPVITDPYASKTQVSFATSPTLAPLTDPYFRGFDNNLPDQYREAEWAREFAAYVQHNDLPSFELVRLMHDHLGGFKTAMAGVNTPDTEVADNDLALGRLIETVAKSPYAGSTLVFVIEDDAQDGPDHVDAHRSEAFVAGPYVKHHAVISTRYSTVNMIRTMEDILGFGPMTLNDAYAPPMADVFNQSDAKWAFNAVEPAPLMPGWHDLHTAAWWADHTRGYDWQVEDHIPTVAFNQLLWEGLMGGKGNYAAK